MKLSFQALCQWRKDDRWFCLGIYALIVAWTSPLWLAPSMIGPSDWDYFVSTFYAYRSSLLDYHQFPGYYPWMYMGAPLWANPQIGPISPLTPFVLLFGPVMGLKLGLIATTFLSFEAARALGRRLFSAPGAACLAAALYALNPALTAHWLVGHFSFVGYAFAPWLLLAVYQLHTNKRAGLLAGLMAGLMVQAGLHYFVIYSFLFAAILAIVVLVRERAWGAGARFVLLALLCFVATSATKLVPGWWVLSDFPREYRAFSIDLTLLPTMFTSATLTPDQYGLKISSAGQMGIGSSEIYTFVGILWAGLLLLSLLRGIRCYHVGALLAFWLMLGNQHPWQLSTWLAKLPAFNSMWLVSRWNVMLLACLAFAAAQGLEQVLRYIPQREPRWQRRWSLVICLLVVAELLFHIGPSWNKQLRRYRYPTLQAKHLGLTPRPHIQARAALTLPHIRRFFYYPLFRINVGAAYGYEPIFGYRPQDTARRYHGHPQYKGEYLVDGASVTPTYWSPNRIVFARLPPGKQLWINATPGRGWKLNGKALYPRAKSFLLQTPFVLTIPSGGKVQLTYTPPGLWWGCGLSLLACLLLLAWYIRERSTHEAEASARESTKEPAADEDPKNVEGAAQDAEAGQGAEDGSAAEDEAAVEDGVIAAKIT